MPYWLNLPFNIREGWENCSHGPRLEWSDSFLFPLLFFHPLKFICKNSFQLSQVIIKKLGKSLQSLGLSLQSSLKANPFESMDGYEDGLNEIAEEQGMAQLENCNIIVQVVSVPTTIKLESTISNLQRSMEMKGKGLYVRVSYACFFFTREEREKEISAKQ